MMKILITGADGLVGGGVASELEPHFEVYTTARRNLMTRKDRHINCDLYEEEIEEKFLKLELDAIVHCAAVIPLKGSSLPDVKKMNQIIDGKIISFCRKYSIKLVYLSAISLYEKTKDFVTESSPISLSTEYLEEKYEAELKIAKNCPAFVILRITSPYGENQRNDTVIKKFLDGICLRQDLKFWGSGKRTQNFIHVKDIAASVEKALWYSENSIFNIAGDSSISMKELAEMAVSIANETYHYNIKAIQGNPIDPMEDCRINVSIAKAKKDLKWDPKITIREGLQACITKKIDDSISLTEGKK